MKFARYIRLLLILAAAAIIAWSFFDVGRRAIAQYEAERARPITLTILHWGDPAENAIVQNLCDRYMAEHPRVRIENIQATDEPSKLKTMMAAGTPPDLFYLSPEDLPPLANLGLLQPVDKFIEADRKKGHDPTSDFYPILLKAFRYNTKTERFGSGPLYGLPKDFTTLVFYVNLDLFKAAGVPVPYKGWTWKQFEADMKQISALNGKPGFKGRKIYGGVLELWDDTLRELMWTYGGDFFGKNFRDVTLDSPACQEALQMVVRLRLKEKTVFNATGIAKNGAQEFVNGNIGCDGPVGRWKVPLFAHDLKFHWDVVPVPYKTKSLQSTQLICVAWTMAKGSKHPQQAWDFMKFLCGQQGAVMQSRAGLAIPPRKSIANSPNFLSPPGLPKMHAQIFLDAIGYSRLQQLPPHDQWKRILDDNITNAIQLGQVSTLQCAHHIQKLWLNFLNSPLQRRQWKPLNWLPVLCIVGAAIFVCGIFLWIKFKREKLGPLDRAQQRAGYAFIAPWLLGFLALTLGPMVLSLILAFTQWTGMTTLGNARSVGLTNFTQMFTDDPAFYQSLKVTIYYVILAVPTGQVAALLVAMLMNVRVKGIAAFRTIYFVPSVVSGAVLSVMWLQIFNNDYGLMNKILGPIAHLLGTTPPDWFGLDVKVWGVPGFVIMSLWGVGGGMIIYLAGLKGIPASLYEAATVDGASAIRKFWTVTLPMLSPLIFYNLIMAVIGSFQVFTQAYMMTGPGPDNATLFYVLNLYQEAFEFHNMGYASAMAWILFVICLVLTLLMFKGSKNLVYYEGLKT